MDALYPGGRRLQDAAILLTGTTKARTMRAMTGGHRRSTHRGG